MDFQVQLSYNTLMHITVLGKGIFGRAIGSLLEFNKVPFVFVDIDLPMIVSTDLLFITVPTQFVRQALTENAQFIKPSTAMVNCAKGIEKDSYLLPFQIIAQVASPSAYYSLIGPSFAEEIVTQAPTLMSLGYAQEDHLSLISDLIQTPFFRVQPTPDFAALELSAALKNVYAITCGYAHGLGFKMNTRAQLITLALQEFATLAQAMSINHHGLAQPGIVGDLLLTCSSIESRNFTFGSLLATMSATDALQKAGPTIEGYHSSISIQALSQKYNIPLPLASVTHDFIEKGQTAKQDFYNFLSS